MLDFHLVDNNFNVMANGNIFNRGFYHLVPSFYHQNMQTMLILAIMQNIHSPGTVSGYSKKDKLDTSINENPLNSSSIAYSEGHNSSIAYSEGHNSSGHTSHFSHRKRNNTGVFPSAAWGSNIHSRDLGGRVDSNGSNTGSSIQHSIPISINTSATGMINVTIATNISFKANYVEETDSMGKLHIGGHAYVIIILSGIVLLAICFTMCGLFYKAEAHKKSDVDDSLLYGHRPTHLISSLFDTISTTSMV